MNAAAPQVEEILSRRLTGDARILDAGCGRKCEFTMPGHVTGMDLIPEGMAGNERLDDRLIGDINEYPFEGDFDAVICTDVLEHLPDPDRAMANLLRAVRPGGLLVFAFPVLWSPKGLITKLTPLRFHVWASRHVFKSPKAGAPGMGPFHTYLRVTPERVERFAERSGLETLLWVPWEAPRNVRMRNRNGLTRLLWAAVEAVYRLWGKDPKATELVAVLRAPA